ncbi:MAG TPA: MFS transporter [Caulobacteraceae bacterium]|jgi:MFS family permease
MASVVEAVDLSGEGPVRPASSQMFLRAAVLVTVGIFSTSMGQDALLGRLPLQNLLKNALHEGRSATAAFFLLTGLPWYFKPLAGILTDAFPIFGSRRKVYLLAGASLGVAAWMLIWITPRAYQPLLWVITLNSTCIMLASTAVGAVLVETAHATNGSGRLTALRYLVQYSCSIAAAIAGGYLATIDFKWTAASCAAAVFLIIPVAAVLLREKRVSPNAAEVLEGAAHQFRQLVTAGSMWAAGGLIALFYIAPGMTTALFFKQQTELHMLPPAQGFLTMITAASAIAGTLTYAVACRYIRLRYLLMICLGTATLTTMGYLFYSSVLNAQIIEVIHGFGAAIATLALVDLATRATPRGSEGLGYALMISITNITRFGTDFLGSLLLDKWRLPFGDLVLANAGTTLIAVPLVLLLPLALVNRRESEAADDAV